MALPELAVQLLQILSPFAMTGLTWVFAQLAMLVRARTGSQVAGTAILKLNDIIATVVSELEQTMVDELKKRSGGASLTKADGDAIKKAALDKIRSYLGPAGLDMITKALGIDQAKISDFIASKVEAAVYAVGMGAVPTLPAFTQGGAGTVYNQQPGEVQKDGSTSTGLPPFMSGPPTPQPEYKGVVPVPGK